MLTTSYSLDYAPPITNKYRFLKPPAAKTKEEEQVEKEPQRPKKQPEQINLRAYWISIAPKGRLFEPRAISSIPDEDVIQPRSFQGEEKHCMIEKPNRFLRVLRTSYPELHAKLANRRGNDDAERLKSTYQINYCHISEYPDGIYGGTAKKIDNNKLKKLDLVDVCNVYKTAEECVQSYTPEIDDSIEENDKHLIEKLKKKSADSTSHWSAEEKTSNKYKLRGYVNSIGKLGCVVQKNKIHDHTTCESSNEPCIEKLKDCRSE